MEPESNPYRSPNATDPARRRRGGWRHRSLVGWGLFWGGLLLIILSEAASVGWRASRIGEVIAWLPYLIGLGMLAASAWIAISGQLRRMR